LPVQQTPLPILVPWEVKYTKLEGQEKKNTRIIVVFVCVCHTMSTCHDHGWSMERHTWKRWLSFYKPSMRWFTNHGMFVYQLSHFCFIRNSIFLNFFVIHETLFKIVKREKCTTIHSTHVKNCLKWEIKRVKIRYLTPLC
jgi:hypothetical protein